MPGEHGYSADLPRPSRRSDEFDPDSGADDRDYSIAPVAVPGMVRTAGIIWIVLGALMIVDAVVNFGIADAHGRGGYGRLVGLGFGMVLVFVGWQSVKGTAKDTLGYGIGSLVIGLLNGCFGVLALIDAAASAKTRLFGMGQGVAVVLFVAGGITIVSGLSLILAGILALIARPAYKAYRRGIKQLRPKDD